MESIVCSNCNNDALNGAYYCPKCSFPEKGTDDEKKRYHEYNRKQIEVYTLDNQSDDTVSIIYFAGFFHIAIAIIILFSDGYATTYALEAFFGIVLLTCALITKKYRRDGIVITSVVNTIPMLVTLIDDGLNWYFFLGLALQALLIRGYKINKKYDALNEELEQEKQELEGERERNYIEPVAEIVTISLEESEKVNNSEYRLFERIGNAMYPDSLKRLRCFSCKSYTNFFDIFCTCCGYPVMGSVNEKRIFLRNKREQKQSIKKHTGRVKAGGVALTLLGAFYLIVGLGTLSSWKNRLEFELLDNDSVIISLIVFVIISTVFFLLSLWSTKRAFPALLVGVVFYTTLQLTILFFEPVAFFLSILITSVFILLIGSGLVSAYNLKSISDSE